MGCHTWFYRKGFKATKKDPLMIRQRVNGKWYINEAIRPVPKNTGGDITRAYHNLFRVSGYPEDILFSLEETKAFISKNNIEKVFWEDLVEFWQVYPDGMILFG